MISRALQHFRIERSDSGVATVWIDVADRSMNVFHDSVIEELESVVSELARSMAPDFPSDADRDDVVDGQAPRPDAPDSITAIVFRSAKSTGFFAGADVRQIAGLADREQVEAVLLRGQKLFARIENLPVPTIAAIHGPCLGGGLEFALACQYRIAVNSSSTRLGLPEIQLGLIPGWGGTQRLPRLIGVLESLPLILKGKKLSASAALKIGLVDAVAETASWDRFVEEFATCLPDKASPRGNWKNRLARSVMDSVAGRWLTLRMAKKRVQRDAVHYPALFAALRAVGSSTGETSGRLDTHVASGLNPPDGFAVEREEFTKLIETSTCRSLLNLFLWREKARSVSVQGAGYAEKTSAHDVSHRAVMPDVLQTLEASAAGLPRLGIVGAGVMGAGIGQLAALKGYDVVLKELTPELAEAGMERIVRLLDDMVVKKRLSTSERDETAKQICVTDRFEDLRDCDLVIEAVVEKPDVKRAVFATLDSVLKPETVIVSNTSALSVTEMAVATGRPERIAGLHFFNPVHRMDLVELIRTPKTDSETISMLQRFVKKLGKTPVVTADSPGFLVNRVLFPYIGEAVRMVMEGHNCRMLDREVRRFGMPMGPIELIDHVGIDVAWHVASTLEDVLPESADVIRMLGQMVARGWTGSKGGQGFYRYTDGRRGDVTDISVLLAGNRITHEKAEAGECSDCHHENVGTFLLDGLTDIQRRLVYPMINEVGFCMQDGVVEESWMADLAMVLGTGFAPFRGGPMTLADSIGRETLLNNFHVLSARYGERFKPSAWMVEKGSRSDRKKTKQGTTV